jgi:hypothetical protein
MLKLTLQNLVVTFAHTALNNWAYNEQAQNSVYRGYHIQFTTASVSKDKTNKGILI